MSLGGNLLENFPRGGGHLCLFASVIFECYLRVFCSFRSVVDILRVSIAVIAVVNFVGDDSIHGALPKLKGMLSIFFSPDFRQFYSSMQHGNFFVFFKAVLASRVTF